ncbi:MAG: HAMP domain-containing protein, partial [Rhodospirillaceae bacterium]
MSKSSFAGQFRVGTRIYTGFVVILLLLGVVAVIGIRGFDSVENFMSRYSTISDNAERVATVNAYVAEMRRTVRLFGVSGEEQYVSQSHETMKKLGELLGLTYSKMLDPKRRANLEGMTALFEAYRGDFEKLIDLRRKRDKLVNEGMNPIGKSLREDLAEIMRSSIDAKEFETAARVGIILEKVMLARLEAVKFIEDPDEKNLAKVDAVMADAVKSSDGLPERFNDPARKRLATQVDANADKYKKAFDDAAVAALAVDDLMNKTMSGRARDFAKLASATAESQHASLVETERQMESTITTASAMEMWIAAAAAFIGLFFAWIVARSITGPVINMTSTMTTLAAGNNNVEVPALDNKDEIGEMAKAVEVFKLNAIEKVRMDTAELARLEAERRA